MKILNLFRDREPAQFAVLIDEYVSMLGELVALSKGEIFGSQTKMVLTVFNAQDPIDLSNNCVLKFDGLSLGSFSECVLLQVSLTKVHNCFGSFSLFLKLCGVFTFVNFSDNHCRS